jgi:hypothetical protein
MDIKFTKKEYKRVGNNVSIANFNDEIFAQCRNDKDAAHVCNALNKIEELVVSLTIDEATELLYAIEETDPTYMRAVLKILAKNLREMVSKKNN